jgi:hypothetical protein
MQSATSYRNSSASATARTSSIRWYAKTAA